MILIRYEDNGYCFMHHTQGDIIFCSTHAIFDKRLFSKYTNSYAKEYKLYNKLLDKISPEIKSSAPNSSREDELAPVPILHTLIPSIQKNPPTCSSSSSLSYKFIFLTYSRI